MKNFPAAFAAQKNLKKGAAPVWILKLRAGGVDYYISDNAFTVPPWGITTKPWAKGWGDLSEGISGLVDEFRISDFSVTCLAEPDASPNIVDLALTYNLEKDPCYLYLWFYGCADPPQEFFRGYLRDYPISEGDTICTLQLQDETLKWERTYVGKRITVQDHPSADPDDIGRIEPIVFGAVPRLRALAVDAGIQTSLTNSVSEVSASLSVADGRGLASGMIIQIDQEKMRVNSVNVDTLSVTRGYGGTLASVHQRGAVAWEQKSNFYYIVAGHAVDSIPKAYAVVGGIALDISSLCTVWPAGDNPLYPGKAVIAVPGYVTIEQAVSLDIDNSLDFNVGTLKPELAGNLTKTGSSSIIGNPDIGGAPVNDSSSLSINGLISLLGDVLDPGHTHLTGQSSNENTTTSLPTNTNWTGASVSDNLSWGGYNAYHWAYWTLNFPADGARSDATYSIDVSITVNAGYSTDVVLWFAVYSGGKFVAQYQYTFGLISGTRTFSFTHSTGSQAYNTVYVGTNQYYHYMQVTSAKRTIQLTGLTSGGNSAFVSKGSLGATHGLTVIGSVLASKGTLAVYKGGLGIDDGVAWDKGTLDSYLSGNLGKTGALAISGNSVANTLVGDTILVDVSCAVTSPGPVIQNLLSTWCGVASFQQVGAFPASYQFNGAITEYRLAKDVIHDLAWQCRSWFTHSMGVAKLIVRSLAPASVKTLPWCRVEGGKKVHSRSKTEYGEIINVINLLYGRDWTRDKGDTAYTAVSSGSDAASIADFGVQERPELFQFDFVTSKAMADDLLAFFLAFYAVRHWAHTWETYYYDSELEFADAVTLGFAKDVLVQIQQAGLQPGSNTIQIKAIQ